MAQGKVAKGLLLAAASGLLYGTITVLAKWVDAHPLAKATLSSLAATVAMSPFLRGLKVQRKDWPKVLAMAFFGGALAPALILFGLEEANASDAGLLLTLELVATAAFAFIFLRERVSARSACGLAALLAAAVAVALASAGSGDAQHRTTWLGILLVGLSALSWGIDNAVSAKLVGTYKPPQLIATKTLIASVLVATAWGGVAFFQKAPAPSSGLGWLAVVAIGAVGVGGSSVLFYQALRNVGAARTSAVNVPTSALAAAAGGTWLLHEPFGWLHAVAVGLILAGMALLWENRDAKNGRPGA
ncbi:MAG: DMT family transporter [Thermoplasmatota archaeon]